MKETKPIYFRNPFFTGLYLHFFSRIQTADSQAYAPSPSCFTVCVLFSGRGNFQVNGADFCLVPGQGLLVPCASPFVCRPAPGETMDYARMGFAGEETGQVFSSLGIFHGEASLFQTDCRQMEVLIRQLPAGSSLEQTLERQAVVCQILAALGANALLKPGDSRRSGLNSYVSRAIEYIIYHYQEPVSVRQLANDLGITRNYLFSLFKEELGCSPRQYLMCFRMEQALILLCQTEYSAEDIALSCGYEDPVVFSRAFKKYYGMSPAACRKSLPFPGACGT